MTSIWLHHVKKHITVWFVNGDINDILRMQRGLKTTTTTNCYLYHWEFSAISFSLSFTKRWNETLSWPYLQLRHWFLIRVNDYDLSNFFLGTVLLCQKKWCARLGSRVKISNPSLLKCLGHIIFFKKYKKMAPSVLCLPP